MAEKQAAEKTLVIHELQKSNSSAIDLEGLAHHKGSSFGALGELPPPTQEQFENNLATELVKNLTSIQQRREQKATIFLEDESQRIGNINIPKALWAQMRKAEVLYLDIDFEERLKWIVEQYGKFEIEKLKEATIRIQKRLGGLILKQTLEHLNNNDLKAAFRLLLEYYDREYDKAYNRREDLKCTKIYFKKMEVEKIAKRLTTTF